MSHMPELTIAQKLRAWCTDWDGSAMKPGEPPRDGLHCDDLLAAADAIDKAEAVIRQVAEASFIEGTIYEAIRSAKNHADKR